MGKYDWKQNTELGKYMLCDNREIKATTFYPSFYCSGSIICGTKKISLRIHFNLAHVSPGTFCPPTTCQWQIMPRDLCRSGKCELIYTDPNWFNTAAERHVFNLWSPLCSSHSICLNFSPRLKAMTHSQSTVILSTQADRSPFLLWQSCKFSLLKIRTGSLCSFHKSKTT